MTMSDTKMEKQPEQKLMKAVVLEKPTAGKDVRIQEIPIPQVQPGWVLVKVMAFGLNHSEEILRQFEIENGYIQKPIVPGIECVGVIADPSDTHFKAGQKVCALMGGMGRSFNGSYAQYALLPQDHVFAVKTTLDWAEMAAVPETFYTAWGSLFTGLQLQKEDHLLIRGATCALGYAAIQIAKAIGCTIWATARKEQKLDFLAALGVDQPILDVDGNLNGKVLDVNKALELIGIRTLENTMQNVVEHGCVCNTGVLGNVYSWRYFDPIKDIPNGVYLTGFYSNNPDSQTMNELFQFLDDHHIVPYVGKVYTFDDIAHALQAQDEGSVNGKIVVVVDQELSNQ